MAATLAPHNTPDAGWMGSPSRGAGMGRPSGPLADLDTADRLTLQAVRLDRGGYDQGGSYWGHHQRLYWVSDECGNSHYFRAPDRAAAKATVRASAPGARFYR